MTEAEHIARLRDDVAAFALHLTEAQAAGVSHALIIPQLMVAFRESFGELPAGTVLPAFPLGVAP